MLVIAIFTAQLTKRPWGPLNLRDSSTACSVEPCDAEIQELASCRVGRGIQSLGPGE